ncbi:MAG: hypothetical protein HC876_22935, partial [Chloroflexaceae bacterium]|nr:hypothetical protein [Chloroflexaceae bacterium]
REATEQATHLVLDALHEPGDDAAVTARVLRAMGQNGDTDGSIALTIPQYAIFAGAVVAHLSYLEQQGKVGVSLDASGLIWQRKDRA